jgi:hypothetical protein
MPAAADCSAASGFRQPLSDTHSHRDWLVDELAPGDAQHAVSDGTEHLPASVVTLERGPVTMSLPPIELDDDLLGRPQQVDLEPADPDVGHRAWQPSLDDEREQPTLGVVAGSLVCGTRAGRVDGGSSAQRQSPRPAAGRGP